MAAQKAEQQLFYKRLGEKIRAYREGAKLSQDAIAQVLGVTRISISNIESGKQKIQLHSLLELCNYLQVSVEQLLPPLRISDAAIAKKIQSSLSKTEVGNNQRALEKIKGFINLTDNS